MIVCHPCALPSCAGGVWRLLGWRRRCVGHVVTPHPAPGDASGQADRVWYVGDERSVKGYVFIVPHCAMSHLAWSVTHVSSVYVASSTPPMEYEPHFDSTMSPSN